MGGSSPPDPGAAFTDGMVLFARQPGDIISTVLVTDSKSEVGSLMLRAGWQVQVAHSLCHPVQPITRMH
jgi:hypothetical protein